MIYRGNDRRRFLSPDGLPAVRGGAADSDESMRQNLRIPLCRDIYLYPVDNSWTGRRKSGVL